MSIRSENNKIMLKIESMASRNERLVNISRKCNSFPFATRTSYYQINTVSNNGRSCALPRIHLFIISLSLSLNMHTEIEIERETREREREIVLKPREMRVLCMSSIYENRKNKKKKHILFLFLH